MAATIASYQIILLVSCFSSAFLFVTALVFSVVVMPGIANLEDAQYLHAFQVMDKIIQDMQPVFAVLWIGSIPSIVASLILGIVVLTDSNQSDESIITMAQVIVLGLATTAVLIGQVVTVRVNIPRNNRVQELDCQRLDQFAARSERDLFEHTWCRYNTVRTWLFGFAFIVQLALLLETSSVL